MHTAKIIAFAKHNKNALTEHTQNLMMHWVVHQGHRQCVWLPEIKETNKRTQHS